MYKIVFAKNEIMTCQEVTNASFSGICHYEQNNGNLIYAIIKCNSEDNALTIARLIVKEAKEQSFGKYLQAGNGMN